MINTILNRAKLGPTVNKVVFLLFVFLMAYDMSSSLSAQSTTIQDSLEGLLKEYTTADAYRVELLIEYAMQHEHGSVTEMLEAANEASLLADQIGRQELIVKAIWVQGYAFLSNGQILEAYERFTHLENEFPIYLSQDLFANTKFGKAKVYESFGQLTDALQNYLISLEAFESVKQPVRSADVKHNIGRLYAKSGNIAEALKYYEDAISAYDQLGSLQRMAYICVDKADLVKSMGRLDEAVIGYRDALRVFEQLGFIAGLIQTHTNLAQVYIEMEDLSKADEELKLAIGYFESQQNPQLGIPIYASYALLFEKRLQWSKALDAWRQVMEWSQNERRLNTLNQALQALSRTYERLGEYKLALSFGRRYQQIQDSLSILNRQSDLESIQTKHALELAEKENLLLQNQAEIERQKAFRTTLFTIGLALILFMLGFFSYFIWRALKKQRLQSQKLHELNEKLEDANLEIRSINENLELRVVQRTHELAQRNHKLEQYAFKHSHELRAPLSRLLGLVAVLDVEEIHPQDKEFKSMLKGVGGSAEELDQIVRAMAKDLDRD